ncbi:hypothetical protein P5673_024538 [Acropora cervicornis]|uniref:Uncharacterized protein n=1 Tax=Acropora cervicornis TaxID=6130 RepID=A0AAD9UYE5_ACRCE|nr:hypothetical protein P5673_024538 [Acropora cervicornis]
MNHQFNRLSKTGYQRQVCEILEKYYGCFLASSEGSPPPLKNRALRGRSHPYQIPRVNTERFKKCFVN